MLELSRLRIGQFNTVMKTFDFKSSLYELVSTFQQEAKIKGVGIHVELEKGNPMSDEEIRTDESKLTLILYNLLSNSVRYSQ